MEVKILKTYEIPEELWEKIAEGFRESFNTHTSAKQLRNSFCVRNKLGYGYHAVAMTEDGDVAGYNAFSPVLYADGLKTVVSGSTYVRPKYRSHEMLFMNMVQSLRKAVKEDGYQVEIGVPNHNSERFALKILKFKPVSELNYYILPLNLSRNFNKSSLAIVDGIIRFCAIVYIKFNLLFSVLVNSKEKQVKYELEVDEKYLEARFGGGKYSTLIDGRFRAFWLLHDENGARVAYLMDFRENGKRTNCALSKAARAIVKESRVDAILFVGYLRLKQLLLFKVPKRFVPKRLPLTYYVLNKEDKNKFADMQNKDNWNFSLMNFDVR